MAWCAPPSFALSAGGARRRAEPLGAVLLTNLPSGGARKRDRAERARGPVAGGPTPYACAVVFQLAYASRAVVPLGTAELVDLLRRSRARNGGRRVTGVLIHHDGRFLQLLEGSRADVVALYAAIRDDPRHREVTTLTERHRLLRQFPGWTMAFRDLVEEPVEEPGFRALVEESLEQVPWAVEELLARLGPAGAQRWAALGRSRVLGRP